MSVLVEKENIKTLIVKGAPEALLKNCSFIEKQEKTRITPSIRKTIEQDILNYEKNGFKPIALAEKRITSHAATKEDEQNLTLLGFLLFHDPPKKSVKESLQILQKLDVKIKIITGDSPEITRHVCREVKLSIVEDKIILEVKAKPAITKEDYFQVKRYLASGDKNLGIVVNFRQKYLVHKRVLSGRINS